jgi:UDP-glucose 6-dehydrogenase
MNWTATFWPSIEVREIRPVADFTVVSNPEFLREGEAIHAI